MIRTPPGAAAAQIRMPCLRIVETAQLPCLIRVYPRQIAESMSFRNPSHLTLPWTTLRVPGAAVRRERARR